MKKSKIHQISGYAILVIIFVGCTLYEKEEKKLTTLTTSEGVKVIIYYVDMGATTKEVIQVRINTCNNADSVLNSFEKNYLQNSTLRNDSTLWLELKDSGSIKTDTVIVKIPKN